jgi:hypothetical protein
MSNLRIDNTPATMFQPADAERLAAELASGDDDWAYTAVHTRLVPGELQEPRGVERTHERDQRL